MTDGKFVFQEKKLNATLKINVTPSKTSQLINDSGFITQEDINLDGYATTEYVDNAVKNVEVDLTDYATTDYVDNAIKEIDVDLTDYYTKEEVDNKIENIDIPTKVSQLENDSGFISSDGGNLHGTINIDAEITNSQPFTIFTHQGASEYAFLANMGGYRCNAELILGGALYPAGTQMLGKSVAKWYRTYTNRLNNGSDIEIPNKAGTLALVEDIDAKIGDISAVLDAINGEVIE